MDGPMSSFNYHAHSQKRWLVWLFATIAGVVNVLLLIVVDIGLSGALKLVIILKSR